MDVPQSISDDNQAVTSSLTVNSAITIGDVNVTLDINHQRAQDLQVALIDPNGQRVDLIANVLFPGDAGSRPFRALTLNDQADSAVTNAANLFTGEFRPQNPLSAFINRQAQGVWTLEIKDTTSGVAGSLIGWSLEVTNLVAEQGSNESIAQAQVVDAAIVVDGGISPGGDLDFYRFSLTATTRVNAQVEAVGGLLDPRLVLMDLNGQEIVRSDDILPGTTTARINQILVAGDYVLRVSAQNVLPNGADQPYRLLVSVDKVDSELTREFVGNAQLNVQTVDINADGFMDIVSGLAAQNNTSILLGDGKGTFLKTTAAIGTSTSNRLEIVDVNRDGKLDLVTMNFNDDNVSVALGNGDGTFQTRVNYTVGDAPNDMIVIDFDGDSDLDILTANRNSDDLSILLGDGNGTFATQQLFTVGDTPLHLQVGHLNGDAWLDVVVANNNSFSNNTSVSVLLGTGNAMNLLGPQTLLASPNALEPQGVEIRDLDSQHADVLVVYQNGVAVFPGDGMGGFGTRRFNTLPGVADYRFTDVNNDQRPDIVTKGIGTDVNVLLGKADGTFQSALTFESGPGAGAILVADINADGNPDVMTANKTSDDVSVLLGLGDGTFTTQTVYSVGSFPEFLALSDFNSDGVLDLVAGNEGSSDLTLLIGNGNGTFQPVDRTSLGSNPRSPLVVDLNADGRPDLVNTNADSNEVSVQLGNGDGSYQPQQSYATGRRPILVNVADLNRDDRLDLIVGHEDSQDVSVLLGVGDGTFQPEQRIGTGGFTTSLLTADVTGDNFLDVIVGLGTGVAVLVGVGDGTFETRRLFGAGLRPESVFTADLNGDTFLDLVAANYFSNDVSVFMGVGLANGLLGSERRFNVGTRPVLLPPTDIDGDQDTDIVTYNVDSDNLSVLLADVDMMGNVTFTAAGPFTLGAIRRESGVHLVNLNEDAFIDVVAVLTDENKVAVLQGQAGGSFSAPSLLTGDLLAGPITLDIDDIDQDGELDLAVGAIASNGGLIEIFLGNGNGTFQPIINVPIELYPQLGVHLVDVNRDTRLDIIGIGSSTRRATTLIGIGDGDGDVRFVPTRGTTVDLRHTPYRADLNNDNIVDTVILNDRGQILFRAGLPGTGNQFAPPMILNRDRPAREIAILNVNSQAGLSPSIVAVDREENKVIFYRFNGTSFIGENELIVGTLPQRLAVADLDADGRDDVVIGNTQGQSVSLALSNGSNTFSLVRTLMVGVAPSDFAFADVDGVNGLDLITSNQSSGDVVIVYNDGAGFANPLKARYRTDEGATSFFQKVIGVPSPESLGQPVALVVGMFTSDARPDLVVVNRTSQHFNTLVGTEGGFTNPHASRSFLTSDDLRLNFRPDQTVTADFDRDLKLDLAILMKDRGEVWVYLGDGNGGFTLETTIIVGNSPSGLSTTQFNDDNNANGNDANDFVDLMVGNGFGDVLFILGNGDGTFRPFVRADKRVPFVTADLDGDQTFDVVMAQQGSDQARSLIRDPNAPAFNQGDFAVDSDDGLIGPGDVALADLDRQFGEDLIFANTGSNNVLVYLRKADGSFETTPQSFFTGTSPTGLNVTQLLRKSSARYVLLARKPTTPSSSLVLADALTRRRYASQSAIVGVSVTS